jgi:WhiB family transcriptional regulator, redox-sensing transcriptional regulator
MTAPRYGGPNRHKPGPRPGLHTKKQPLRNTGSWPERAACQDKNPEIWYPPPGSHGHDAKRICDNCKVESECLTYALVRPENYGIWGGLTEHQREELRRRR